MSAVSATGPEIRKTLPERHDPQEPAPSSPRFSHMRVREEDCNMVLLAAITLFSLVVAGVASVLDPAPLTPSEAKNQIYLADQMPVRVIGAPLVPNTNPRER
jgi:hypothetical protein